MIRSFPEASSQKTKGLKEIYSLVRKYGPVSKAALIEKTGLKQSTCARFIEELLQAGVVKESGFGASSGGRRPVMYEIEPNYAYLIGVDISRTYTKVLLMNLGLSILKEARLPMDARTTPEITLSFIEEHLSRMLAQIGLSKDMLLGIGIGSVGPIDRDQGMIINPYHFPAGGWTHVPIVEKLKRKFQTLVLLDNGANTAVLGEYRMGWWREVKSVVYNLAGIGIRTGVLTNEQVVRAPVDMEGAYGHTIVDVHGQKCTCGNFGCLETVGTILAIKDNIIRRLKRGHPSILQELTAEPDEVDFLDICRAVREGDLLCTEVVKDCAFYYGIGLSNLIYLIHPELVILGGALVTEMEIFYLVATETARKRVGLYPGYPVRFSRGILGENAVAVGAASMVFDHYIL